MTTENTAEGMGIKRRGLASMGQQRRRQIASAGGNAAQSLGTAHRWTPEEAREAGRKGAASRLQGRRTSLDRVAQPTPNRILVIEDDPDQARLVERWLKNTGRFDVIVAGDGHAGRQLLGAQRWALVVSDIRLPGVDGCQLLRDFRTRDSQIPFVLMSGLAVLSDAQTAIRYGASDLFTKPLDHQTFVRRVLALAGSGSARRARFEAPIAMLMDGLVHDVANRATLVSGFVDLLMIESARSSPLVAAAREHGDTIANAVQAMVAAIRDMQKITRWSPVQRDHVNLTHLVADTLRLIRHRLSDHGVRLRFNHGDASAIVESDPVRLRYLIVALVLAVFEARVGGGDVIIAVSSERTGPRVAVWTTRADRMRLQVAVDALAPYLPVPDGGTDRISSLVLESRRSKHVACLTFPIDDGAPPRRGAK